MGISSKFTMKIWEIMGDLMRQFSKLVIHAVHLTAFYHLTFRYTAVYLIYWVIQSSEMKFFFINRSNKFLVLLKETEIDPLTKYTDTINSFYLS